jgi:hypothetical protein
MQDELTPPWPALFPARSKSTHVLIDLLLRQDRAKAWVWRLALPTALLSGYGSPVLLP